MLISPIKNNYNLKQTNNFTKKSTFKKTNFPPNLHLSFLGTDTYKTKDSSRISFETSNFVDELYNKFNKPTIPFKHIEQWLNQFPPNERKTAIKLANAVDYYSYSDVFKETQKLHKKLCIQLQKDGFDTKTFSDVDFTKAYTCKSGDIISYIYRKANKIRNVCFKTIEGLIAKNPNNIQNRALVILDDYTGSGSQFLSEFYAKTDENRELLNKYKKIYFVPLVANISAIQKFQAISNGEYDKAANMIIGDCPENHKDGLLNSALKQIANKKLQIVEGKVEYPLLSENNKKLSDKEKQEIRNFLLKYNAGTPFGFGDIQGHSAFFFTVPNNTPDVLWNSKLKEKGIIPLFQRTNDISIYPMSQSYSIDEQVW